MRGPKLKDYSGKYLSNGRIFVQQQFTFGRNTFGVCRCHCGKVFEPRIHDLLSGSTQSCGRCKSPSNGVEISRELLDLIKEDDNTMPSRIATKPRVFKQGIYWCVEHLNKIVGIYTSWEWAMMIGLKRSRQYWFDNTSWGLYLELASDLK